jgi:hypothetical protein
MPAEADWQLIRNRYHTYGNPIRERHAHEHGLTPEQERKLESSRRFQAAQQRWGRDTMGFALYLFRRPVGA